MLILVCAVNTCHMTLFWFCYDAAQSSQCVRFLYYRICVKPLFKHARLAIKRSQTPCFLHGPSSMPLLCLCEQRRLWRDCADAAQSHQSLHFSHICDKSQILMNWLYTVLLYLLRRNFRLFHPLLWRGVPVTNYVPCENMIAVLIITKYLNGSTNTPS